jgi:uncharacterized membrane protein YfcA
MTRPSHALRLALRDLYANSWRLLPINAALGALLVAVGIAAFAVRAAVILVVLAGPVAAALVHSAVTLVRTGNLAFADVRQGLGLHWRRGFALGAGGAALVFLGVFAVRFYSRSPLLVPLVFLTLYLLFMLAIFQAVLWTLAIAEPSRPLSASARAAAELVARRPGSTLLLGLALFLVNAIGIAAAVMPFLTLTLAYSSVAAAHFALPAPTLEDGS